MNTTELTPGEAIRIGPITGQSLSLDAAGCCHWRLGDWDDLDD